MYDSIKTIHFFFIFSSLGFFLLRSIWMLQGSTWLNKAFVKRAPHVIDTLLLCSGIGLIIVTGLNPLTTPWLAAKLGLLISYILCGAYALRYGKTLMHRIGFLLLALMSFGGMIFLAVTKTL